MLSLIYDVKEKQTKNRRWNLKFNEKLEFTQQYERIYWIFTRYVMGEMSGELSIVHCWLLSKFVCKHYFGIIFRVMFLQQIKPYYINFLNFYKSEGEAELWYSYSRTLRPFHKDLWSRDIDLELFSTKANGQALYPSMGGS